jgi:hypothetical protein
MPLGKDCQPVLAEYLIPGKLQYDVFRLSGFDRDHEDECGFQPAQPGFSPGIEQTPERQIRTLTEGLKNLLSLTVCQSPRLRRQILKVQKGIASDLKICGRVECQL